MWKISRKYPFIELMTYLDCLHTHKLLYKVSQDFRLRLISSLKTFKTLKSNQPNKNTVKVSLKYFTADPNTIHISEESLNEIRACSQQGLDLEIMLQLYGYAVPPKQKSFSLDIPEIFGKVQVSIQSRSDDLHKFIIVASSLLTRYFKTSKPIEYRIEIQCKSYNKIQTRLDSEQFIVFNIEQLKLRANDVIFLSVQCLLKVKNLQLCFNDDDELNVQFENLSFPYPQTEFSLYFFRPLCKTVVKVYTKEPGLFSIQKCKIFVRWSMDNNIKIDNFNKLLEIFNENIFKLYIIQVNKLEIDYLQKIQKIQEQCKNLSFVNITDTIPLEIKGFNEKLKVQKLSLQFEPEIYEYSIENLSQIQIQEEIEIQVKFNVKLKPAQLKINSPPKIIIKIENIKFGWVQSVIGILDNFYNQENVSVFHLQSSMHNIPQGPHLVQLYEKLEQMQKIRELTIPISCEKNSIIKMTQLLGNLKKLDHLSLENFREQPEINQVVNQFSQFAIENMENLRALTFYVNSKVKMKRVTIGQRLSSLVITVVQANGFASSTRIVYDTNIGINVISKFENIY